ncbi:MAG: hypothetical protein OFPII_29000 [Osedax symbiont Rs1]|nr:MAG: hypothetical protein OFPII_29000 [Osedax symbiont Rs1]
MYQFCYSLMSVLVKYRIRVLLFSLVMVAALLPRLGTLQLDNSNEAFLPESDPSIAEMAAFKKLFGNEDTALLLVPLKADKLVQQVRQLEVLSRAIEQQIPYVKSVYALHNLEVMRGDEQSIRVEPLLKVAGDNAQISQLLDSLRQQPLYADIFINQDASWTGVLVEFFPYPKNEMDPRKEVAPAFEKLLAQAVFSEMELILIGDPIFDYEMDQLIQQETGLLWLCSIVLEVLMLWYFLRSFRLAWVPVVVMVLATLTTFGLISFFGWKMTMLVSMVPSLIMCIGIADSVHISCAYQDEIQRGSERMEALKVGASKVFLPCLLTSLTTAAGFLAFMATDIAPLREVGIYSAIGVVLALVFSYLLVPVMLAFGPKPVKSGRREGKPDLIDRYLARLADSVIARPLRWGGGFFLLSAALIAGMPFIELDTNPIKGISERTELRQKADFVDLTMGGIMTMDVVINRPLDKGIHSAEFIAQMEGFISGVRSHSSVVSVRSLNDVLASAHRVLKHKSDTTELPDSRAKLIDYLFLYEMGGGTMLDQFVSFDSTDLRIAIRTRSLSTRDSGLLVDFIRQQADEMLGSAVPVAVTGPIVNIKVTADYLAEGQKSSFALAFGVIALIMMVVLRSPVLGMMSLLPNILPIFVALGLMGWAGISLSLSIIIFAPLVLGVAVDDTIHFLVRFRKAFDVTGDYASAIRETIISAGRPLIFTTFILANGFSVLAISVFQENVTFGYLAGFAFTWALLADLILLPALLLLLKPLKAPVSQTPVNQT